MSIVIKRDGKTVDFDKAKIVDAITKAMEECGCEDTTTANKIATEIEAQNEDLTVDEIQDIVERKLMCSSHKDVAKAYILYREERDRIRNIRKAEVLASVMNTEDNSLTRENANINADTPAGMMMKFASESSREFATQYLLSAASRNAVKDNYLHIHDLDYYPTKSTTCLQHPLDKILEGGFKASDGTARPCKRIETAGALAAIAMQTVQNEQHGGQSIPAFDFYLAPYVRMTFEEEMKKIIDVDNAGEHYVSYNIIGSIEESIDEYETKPYYGDYVNLAISNTVKRVHQTMEAFIHNMNTMRSRGGGQTVFSSINYGTDTSPEGRLIIRELLKCTLEGVGNGETAIFPIQIFKLKKGVNAEKGDPNYDLLELACECTAKRFFPNYLNLDAPFNVHPEWTLGDYRKEPATMGCRTRVFENRCGEVTSIGRGNLSFTTINLVRLALENPNISEFLEQVSNYTALAIYQLIDRLNFQSSAKKKQFPMLMSGMWNGSEELGNEDCVGKVLQQGTLSVGFIGLAECLIALTGKHHGESEEAQKLGLEIVQTMKKVCDSVGELYNLNIGVLATPAEGSSGKFVIKDREDFGIIPNVTDRDYYTNSNHVPVWYKCSMEHKCKIEAPYHALTLSGHIFYVEFDGDAAKNPSAVMDFIKLIREYNVGYASVNHARSRCLDCGFENGEADLKKCPSCGSTNIDILQRITGYIVGSTNRWNKAKKAELHDRVTHDI